MLRNLLLCTFFGCIIVYYYYSISSIPFLPSSTHMASPQSTWSSPFSSWHSRALLTPHPSPHSFTPDHDSLVLAVLLNAQAETEGFTLAVFSQTLSDEAAGEMIAVDALGRVLRISGKDSAGILELGRKVLDLPDTGNFRNTWIVDRETTSQPIDRIFIPSRRPSASENSTLDHLKQVSVQGFSKGVKKLKRPFSGNTQLPDVLWELAGLVLEAREDAGDHERRDKVVLAKVRDVVKGLF